jgi:transcriptional regulator with XRE-family HTH domain
MPRTSSELSVNQEIGQRIMSERRRQKLTQRDLAYKLDISYQMLQKHERGTTPLSVDRMLLIAQVLACPASDLFPDPKFSRKSKELLADGEEERELIRAFRKLPSNVTRLRFLELLKEFLIQFENAERARASGRT